MHAYIVCVYCKILVCKKSAPYSKNYTWMEQKKNEKEMEKFTQHTEVSLQMLWRSSEKNAWVFKD